MYAFQRRPLHKGLLPSHTEELSLDQCRIEGEDLGELPHLRKIDMLWCSISPSAGYRIAELLSEEVVDLKMADCFMDQEPLNAIYLAIKDSKLVSLELSIRNSSSGPLGFPPSLKILSIGKASEDVGSVLEHISVSNVEYLTLHKIHDPSLLRKLERSKITLLRVQCNAPISVMDAVSGLDKLTRLEIMVDHVYDIELPHSMMVNPTIRSIIVQDHHIGYSYHELNNPMFEECVLSVIMFWNKLPWELVDMMSGFLF